MTASGVPPSDTEASDIEAHPDRPIRRYQAAVSAGAMAASWANQENAPSGALVIVDHEVSPTGRLGELWRHPAASSLTFAVVLRPPLTAEESDLPWLMAAMGTVEGAADVVARPLQTYWPDLVVDAETGAMVGRVKAEVQLGPGRVRVAVVTIRVNLDALDVECPADEVIEAIAARLDQSSIDLADGVAGLVSAYERRCATVGETVRIRLLPRGEARGKVSGIDPTGRLELRSSTGMVERMTIDMVRDLFKV